VAGYGPPPAENKRRRNPDKYEGLQVTVTADGKAVAPPLPKGYSPKVEGWYATWTSAPQAQAFTVTDWQRLHMLAPLVERYFATWDRALMAEIRLNESLLGATHVDRLRARIKLAEAEAERQPDAAQDEVASRRRKRMQDAS